MNLRLTTAGRALLADGTNTGTAAVALTHLALGSGSAAAGAANDAKTALITERDRSALGGAAEVAGQIAFRADFSPAASYSITEAGLFGRVGASGAVTMIAYWTAGGDALAAAVSGAALTVGGVLEVQAAAADVTVTIATTVQFGDPALALRVTAVEGRNTAQDTLLAGLRTDLAALQAAAITAATIERYTMPAEIEVRMTRARGDATWTLATEGLAVDGVTVTTGADGYITFGPGTYRVTGRNIGTSGMDTGFAEWDASTVDDLIAVAAGGSQVVRPTPRNPTDAQISLIGNAVVFIRRIGDAPA